jgi:large subunit ribosomal protein L6
MSRIGKMKINLPNGVSGRISDGRLTLAGPKGTLEYIIPEGTDIKLGESAITVANRESGKDSDALFGFVRAYVANIVYGVDRGWTKTLELSGVGYRAVLNGSNLVLNVGFSHPVTVVPPPGISFSINEGKIVVAGIDKQLVGQIAAKIREVKKPEPYKGKGIKYLGEYIRKKAGKTAKAVGIVGSK